MKRIHLVKDLIQKSDLMVKIDLTDTYLTVQLLKQNKQYLQFQWHGKNFKFKVLRFGISVAPLEFTILMKVPARLGNCLVIYLDDILIIK